MLTRAVLLPLRSVPGLGDLLGRAPPGLVLAVPADRLRETGGEVGAPRLPAELAAELWSSVWIQSRTLRPSPYEEGHIEYFRYPEYGGAEGSSLFKGMKLDIHWISYNLALITLKLLHLAGIER